VKLAAFLISGALAESDTPLLCPSCETVAKRIFSPPMILTRKLRLKGQENRELQVIKRSEEPLPQRNPEHRGGRPDRSPIQSDSAAGVETPASQLAFV